MRSRFFTLNKILHFVDFACKIKRIQQCKNMFLDRSKSPICAFHEQISEIESERDSRQTI